MVHTSEGGVLNFVNLFRWLRKS